MSQISILQQILTHFLLYRRDEEERRRAEEEAAKAALTAEEEAELANQPPPVLPYSSMFIFSSTNEFRCAIHTVVTFPLFDVFIMIVSSENNLAVGISIQ